MQKLLAHSGSGLGHLPVRSEVAAAVDSASLLEALWRRRWTLAVTVFACVAAAAAYLVCATRIFSASSTVMIEQNGVRAFSESNAYIAQSESYLQTQGDVFRSTPVLTRALEAVNYKNMKTFAGVEGDVAAWLRKGNGLKVETPRKSDTVVVTMESPYPQEATQFVDAVVESYIVESAQQKRATGDEIIRALAREKEELTQQREACVKEMLRVKLENSVLSFKDDKSNTDLDRMVALNTSLTAAQIATIELRGQEKAIREAISNPETLASFVHAQQAKGRDSGDDEYNELRRQLVQHSMMVGQNNPLLGSAHPKVHALQSIGDTLRKRIAEKDLQLAKAQLVAVTTQLTAAAEKEEELKDAMQKALKRSLDLTPDAAEYARHEAEHARLDKQIELIGQRMNEVTVNNSNSAPLNVRVLEPAQAGERAIKPKKPLVLGVGMMAGWLLGIGLCLVREWRDARLRTPDEILTVLGMPVVASVPKINKRLSATTRGQMVRFDARSPVAEAYRSVRTSIHLGVCGQAKTILMASPMEGDGKSTTVSNVAIAFAHAGERTLVLDCDLREPVQHLIFEVDGRVGLTNALAGEVKLQEAIAPTEVPGLYLLPCGPVPVNPSELLTSKKFARLMRALGDTFDRIIIDSPPLMMFTDAHVLAASADATLLVLRMNQSARQLGTLAMDGLTKVGANVVGAVANDAVAGGTSYRKYGGSWQYTPREEHYRGSSGGEREVRAVIRDANGGANGRKKAEALAIAEPDWSSDGL